MSGGNLPGGELTATRFGTGGPRVQRLEVKPLRHYCIVTIVIKFEPRRVTNGRAVIANPGLPRVGRKLNSVAGGTMFDDLFEDIDFGGRTSKRTQTIFRIGFGAIGFFLAIAGMVHVLFSAKYASVGLPFRLAGANLFAFLGLFCALNVALHKPWRWPGRGFLASLVLLIVVRIVFGA